MKILILAAGMVGLSIAASAVLRRDHKAAQTGLYGNGFAVVELFTSEGCSSCPPADALVARVQEEDKDLPVYILAFHVDYWDRLGWKDVFSDAAYTDRQKRYAAWLNLSTIYTPQIVVNGRKEFVGSQQGALFGSIKAALQQPGGVLLDLDGLQLEGNRLSWVCRSRGAIKAGEKLALVVAAVERSAVTSVKGGENHGRTLSHVQIVRGLETASPDDKGNSSGQLEWPAGIGPGNGEVIAFLQDQDDGRIIAATSSSIK